MNIQDILDNPISRERKIMTLRRSSMEWRRIRDDISHSTRSIGAQDRRRAAHLKATSLDALADLYEHADKPYLNVEETYWDIVPWNPSTIHLTATGDCALA